MKSVPQLLCDEQKQQEFLAAENMAVVYLCHCSPDLAYDSFVIQGKKLQLWGHCFQDFPDMQEQLLTALLVIPKVNSSVTSSNGRSTRPVV